MNNQNLILRFLGFLTFAVGLSIPVFAFFGGGLLFFLNLTASVSQVFPYAPVLTMILIPILFGVVPLFHPNSRLSTRILCVMGMMFPFIVVGVLLFLFRFH